MAVLYHEKLPPDPREANSRINKWYLRLQKFWLLVPFFPKDSDHHDRWWYKLGYSASLISSVWFYLLAAYFIFLASGNNFDSFYLIGAAIWAATGLILPTGVYRLIVYYLILKKYIF